VLYLLGDKRCNVVLWMDHRAGSEAELINSTRHPVLRSVGGSISLEMHLPKLLWLKKVSVSVNCCSERFILSLPCFIVSCS